MKGVIWSFRGGSSGRWKLMRMGLWQIWRLKRESFIFRGGKFPLVLGCHIIDGANAD